MDNGWSPRLDALLVSWGKQVALNETVYHNKGSFYWIWYLIFGVVGTILQTGALLALITAIAQNRTDTNNDISILLISVTIAESFTLILQSLDKFLNFGSLSEKHHFAAQHHNDLARYIQYILILDYKQRDPALGFLKEIREQFHDLQKKCPPLPRRITQLDFSIYEDPRMARKNLFDQTELPNLENIPSYEPETKDSVDLPSGMSREDIALPLEAPIIKVSEQKQKITFGILQQQNRSDSTKKNLEYQWRRMNEEV